MPDPHAPGSTSLSAAGRALIHALCEATRTETVQEGAFAEPSAHAAYVRRNLCSRASSLASMLLLDVLVRGKHAEDVPQEELRAREQQLNVVHAGAQNAAAQMLPAQQSERVREPTRHCVQVCRAAHRRHACG